MRADRQRWELIGVLVIGAIVAPVSHVVAIVIFLVAVALFLRWRGRQREPVGAGEYAAGAFALACSGLGAILWPLVAWHVTGVRTAYVDTMAAWRVGHVIEPLTPWLGMSQWAFRDFHGDRKSVV